MCFRPSEFCSPTAATPVVDAVALCAEGSLFVGTEFVGRDSNAGLIGRDAGEEATWALWPLEFKLGRSFSSSLAETGLSDVSHCPTDFSVVETTFCVVETA
jgi:hypothetical protein